MISYKTLIMGWDEFFFAPKPTESIAIFRILWGSLLLIYFFFDLGNIETIYGPHGILSLKTVSTQFQYPHLNLFNLFGNSYDVTYTIFTIYGLAILGTILGFYTRASLLTLLCCMVSIHHRNIWVTSSSETLIRIMTILLLCSPCGHSFSIDSLLGRKYPSFKKNRDWAPWALRLMQIQLCVVYLCTVWQKLKGETWFDGTALYYATRYESMKNFPLPIILENLAALKLLTWGTLLIEIALGTLVWIKEFRKPIIIAGIGFHLGIEYVMSIPFFEWAMMFLLFLFVTPLEVRDFIVRLRQNWISQIQETPMDEKLKSGLIWIMKPILKEASC